MLAKRYLPRLAMLLEFVWVDHLLPRLLMYLPRLVLGLPRLLVLFFSCDGRKGGMQ